MFWERAYAEIAQNLSKPPKIAEHPNVERLEPPGQLWCVPKAERYMEIIEIRIRSGQFEAQTGKVTWRFREKSPEFSMNFHLGDIDSRNLLFCDLLKFRFYTFLDRH